MGVAASGDGLNGTVDGFSVKHLPELRRLQWLEMDKARNDNTDNK